MKLEDWQGTKQRWGVKAVGSDNEYLVYAKLPSHLIFMFEQRTGRMVQRYWIDTNEPGVVVKDRW